jgi:hypothetical protein
MKGKLLPVHKQIMVHSQCKIVALKPHNAKTGTFAIKTTTFFYIYSTYTSL